MRELLKIGSVLSGEDVTLLKDLTKELISHQDEALAHSPGSPSSKGDLHSRILHSLPLGIWVLDPSFQYIYVSPFVAHSLGCVPEDIIGKTGRELKFSDRVLDQIEEDVAAVFSSGESLQREIAYNYPDGTRFKECIVYPLLDEEGTISQVAVISYDITERKNDRREQQRLNTELSTITETIRIVNSSQDLYQMLDTIIRLAMERLSFDAGWIYLKGMIGSQVELFAHRGVPDDFVSDQGSIETRNYPHNVIFYAGISRFVENTPAKQPGIADARILESVDAISYAGVPLMAGSVVLGGLFLAKRAEGTIPALDREVLESIGKEVGSTVLRGMLQERLEDMIEDTTAYLDLLSNDIRKKNEHIENLAQSIRPMLDGPAVGLLDLQLGEIQQVRELVENITTIRKLPETGEDLVPVDLDEVITSAQEIFPSTRIEYEASGVHVLADDFLPVIFSNLIGNSIKFGGPDVHIKIRTEKAGSLIEMSLEDDGPGIPDAAKSMLLASSQDPVSTIPGKCMGLYLIHTLIERYGGGLHIEDRVPGDPSQGLAVRFMLFSAE